MPDIFGASGQFSIDALNNQSQNVFNNLYGGGSNAGFGAQTSYYSGLGASYGRATGGFGGGGEDASPYQTTPDVWNTGASGFSYPGAGSINWDAFSQPASPYQTSPNVFSSGLGGGASPFQYGGAGLDWSNLFQAPQQSGFGMSPGALSSIGGLGGAGYTPSPGDWGNLFGGGGGGAKQGPSNAVDWSNVFGAGFGGGADQLPKPQQQPADYGSLFGQGVGGSAPEPENTVADPNRMTYGGYGKGGATSELPGYMANNTLPAELRPSAAPEPGSRSYDFAPMFEAGGGGETTGFESAKSGSLGGSAFTYNPYSSGGGGGFDQSAESKAEQARASLASLIGGPSVEQQTAEYRKAQAEAEKAAETPVVAGDDTVPLPRERPAGAAAQPAVTPGATTPATDLYPGANPPRPPANIPFTVERGKEAAIRAVQPRLSAAVQGGATFLPPGYTVEAYSGAREGKGQAYHRGGHAMDVRIIGPDGPIPSEGADKTGMYTLLARGIKTWAGQNDPGLLQTGIGGLGWGGAFGTQRGPSGGANIIPDLMHFDLGGSRGALRPEVQFGNLQPLTAEERNAMPAYIPELGANQVALDPRGAGPIGPSAAAPPLETRLGVNQGQDITPPPASIPDPRVSSGGFNALDAAANVPKGPSGVEKAQTFLNRSVESILQERAPQHLTAAGFAMDIKQPLREALKGPFGDQILSGLQPKLGDVGLTRSDFAKAVANPMARFAEGPFGQDYPDYTGPENWHGGGYPEFRRQDASIDDRRGEPEPSAGFFNSLLDKALNRGSAITDNAWRMWGPQEDPGEMGRALGYDDIMTTQAPEITPEMVAMLNKSQAVQRGPDLPAPEATSMRDFQSPANDYSMFQAGTRDLSNPVDAAIAESAPATGLDFAHWKAIADIESSLNPLSNRNVDTQYKGLYQLGSKASDPEWATHGMGDIYNATDNALAASRLFQYNAERFKNVYGRDPTPGEAYVLHNQGLGFFTRNLAPVGNNVPGGHGFTTPPTHDTFLTDWNRYLEEKAAGYR